jgi:hypothetical protein
MAKETPSLSSQLLHDSYKSFFTYRKSVNDIDYSRRYSSWDLCYNHFQKFFEKTEPLSESDRKSDIETAALHLGFYLGSWGMLRNSDLLNYGIEKYKLLAQELRRLNKESSKEERENFKAKYDGIKSLLTKWNVEGIKNNLGQIRGISEEVMKIKFDEEESHQKDLDLLLKELMSSFSSEREIIIKSESARKSLKKLKKTLKQSSDDKKDLITRLQKELVTTPTITLITKIMLGVYANTPAIDRFFKKAAKEHCGINFYPTDSAEKVFEKICDLEGKNKNLPESDLSKYKILDAIFFEIGRALSKAEKEIKLPSKHSE